MSKDIENKINNLENGFFGWWVKNYKVSLLIMVLILFYGSFSLYKIPKESSPDIKFGLVMVSTIYPGVNPLDIDTVITQKVEQELKDIQGVDKIESTSSLGASNVVITLKNGVATQDFINEARTAVNKIQFPNDVKTPSITELSSSSQRIFELTIFGHESKFSQEDMRDAARIIKSNLEGKYGITNIDIGNSQAGQRLVGSKDGESDYNIRVLLDKKKVEYLGLDLYTISQTIKDYLSNQPLGNHKIGDYRYDIRIEGERTTIEELLKLPISLGSTSIPLANIAKIERHFVDESERVAGIFNNTGNNAAVLTFFKEQNTNIFTVSADVKEGIKDIFGIEKFRGMNYDYANDLAEMIRDDYDSLSQNGFQAIGFIFLITMLFIGFKQSLIATIAMPLSFFITFMFLYWSGNTLNFLTNFSLVLTFGMGIDTVIVNIEAAYENMKKGFSKKSAILLAVRKYSAPIISSALCNLIVFIPLLALPGIIGKFLAIIPITVFVTLLGSLFLSITLNSALFFKLNKEKTTYYEDGDDLEEMLTPEEIEILEYERKGKTLLSQHEKPKLDRVFDRIIGKYSKILTKSVNNRRFRIISIVGPILLLLLTFVILSPNIGFKLFPSGDNVWMFVTIEAPIGTDISVTKKYAPGVENVLSTIPEIKNYDIKIKNNVLNVRMVLFNKDVRDSKGQRDSFTIEEDLDKKFSYLVSKGLKIESEVAAGGPPQGKAVGIGLTTENNKDLPQLAEIAKNFENYLKTLTGATNVTNSYSPTRGQFVFKRKESKMNALGLKPSDILPVLSLSINGLNAGSIRFEGDDRDIKVYYESYTKTLSPSDVEDINIQTKIGLVKAGTVLSYAIDEGISYVSRKDTKIVISVEADLEKGFFATDLQGELENFANNYEFPKGITYLKSGENEENAELIQSTLIAFVVAIFLIFIILTLQFNSFGRPMIILYSIVLALLGVNIGLYVTGNPYSMSFAIGFISLIGIVVNNAILLVDRMKENQTSGISGTKIVIEAAVSRFKPVVISTLTTILGIISMAFKDAFRAGLTFTIVFGLVFSASMTLFVVPNLYYQFFVKKEKGK